MMDNSEVERYEVKKQISFERDDDKGCNNSVSDDGSFDRLSADDNTKDVSNCI